MEQKELFKDIDIDGRKFRLGKFDARTGSFMLFKMMGIIAPIFKNITKETKDKEFDIDDINLTELMSSIFSLPEKDFKYIQDNCLKATRELLPGNDPQILDEFGTYGAINVEFDTMLVLNLTVQTLIFNLSGFFKGNLLDSLTKRLNTFQQNSKM